MKKIADRLLCLITFHILDDPLIRAFITICGGKKKANRAKALRAYSDMCEILLCKNTTLSDYLRDLLLYSDAPLIQAYLRDGEETQRDAIFSDVAAVKAMAQVNAGKLKAYLEERYKTSDTENLPEYRAGEFPYDGEFFLERASKDGWGIFAKYKAFSYAGSLVPITHPDKIHLKDLKRYELQKEKVLENTKRLIEGKPAFNVLLYGDRGTGKSSTVKAMANEFPSLRIVQLDKSHISDIFDLYDLLRDIPLKFIVFIDDLSFGENEEGFGVLKKALDGSLAVSPDNVAVYATTNRRHIIRETAASREGEPVHIRDAVDDSMSLADRFGLFITFTSPDRETYLDIVRQIARDKGLDISQEELEKGAEYFAIRRSGCSPRIAVQYVESLMREGDGE